MKSTVTCMGFAARKNDEASDRNLHITTFRNIYGCEVPNSYER
jgi:hypothetical protein